MRWNTMFITAVCVIFLIKLRWLKNKSLKHFSSFLRKYEIRPQKKQIQIIATKLTMGFYEFQAVKFSQSREIYQCTRKRQGCTRNRHTSGRGSPPDRSI